MNNKIAHAANAMTWITIALSQDVAQLILLVLGIISTIISISYNIIKAYKDIKKEIPIETVKNELEKAIEKEKNKWN